MSVDVDIRQLGADDAAQYKTLRLLGLKTRPEAFGSDYAEDLQKPDSAWLTTLTGNRVFIGAFASDILVGMANFEPLPGSKLQHRAFVYGVFVHPDYSGQGIGSRILDVIAARAAEVGITQLHLGVGAENEPAKRLYTKAGFETYGHEPSAIRLPDRDIDELLMIKFLS
ncbi:MAG: GNAT family N-acetyltransferase [Pseudomonadota bacterium]